MVLGDTRVLRVRMAVEERDIGRLALGSQAHVTADAFPGRRFPGRVVEIGRRMGRKNIRTDDPVECIDTKILEVVIELDKTEALLPGLRLVSVIGGA
ncbi:HlyD family efflux transporter periplasmic adaptor subunit [Nannocystis pusilla]|uniref:HlyD family efflux transporter periplasmic adaptor subunit n=1 Tax=Nannocystis pusilla TaxID=889268 RepID=UPI003B76A728